MMTTLPTLQKLTAALAMMLALPLTLMLPLGASRGEELVSFAGKRVTMLIGFSAIGGIGYDTYGRILARHLGRHLPGEPIVVPENKPGAGSMGLANYLYNVAPRDGTEIGLLGRGVAMDPIISGSATSAKFDASKFNWLGSMNNEVAGFFVSNTSPVQTLAQVLAGTAMTVGSTGAGGDPQVFGVTLNAILHTRLKIIAGYPGMNEILLGMEKGELDGVIGYSWGAARVGSRTQLADGKLKIILQLALSRHQDLPDVPLVMDLVKDPQESRLLELIFSRQSMGRPLVAPPSIDPRVAAALRQSIADTMHDPAFVAEAARTGMEIQFVSGEDVQRLVERLYSLPQDVVERVQKMLAAK
jgi:tripartite-type tricarboxylate transporter receptor subunit TctC